MIFINDDHVLLDDLYGHQLTLKRDLFDLHFENFVYSSEIESEEIDMTREEAIQVLRDWDGYFVGHSSDDVNEALNMAIEALEQNTVPFDFDLYQAGLMDMPEEMIKVLDKIRAEIYQKRRDYITDGDFNECTRFGLMLACEIIDRYKAESEDEE